MTSARSILLAVALAACTGASAGPTPHHEVAPMTDFRGTIRVDTAGTLDAEVFLLDQAGKVLATTKPDAKGAYSIPVPAPFAGGFVLAKLYKPVVGARAAPVGPKGAQVDVAVPDGEALPLTGTVAMPSGVAMTWLDVHLTPRAIDGLPQAAFDALLATGPAPVRRGTYVTTRITAPSFAFHVMPGVYRLEVERTVEGSTVVPAPNVQLGAVTIDHAPPPDVAPIGSWLTVRQPTKAQVQMTVVAPMQ